MERKYVALGDSIAVGYGDSQGKGYVGRFKDYLECTAGDTYILESLALNGFYSGDLLRQLRDYPTIRNSIAEADAITFSVGLNDINTPMWSFYGNRVCGGADNQDCMRQALAHFKANWSATLVELASIRSPSSVLIRTMDVYDPVSRIINSPYDSWPADSATNYQVWRKYLDELNYHIHVTSWSYSIPVVLSRMAMNGPTLNGDPQASGLLYTDGAHPNDAGYEAIAGAFRNLGTWPPASPRTPSGGG